jgi:hypothetical protein
MPIVVTLIARYLAALDFYLAQFVDVGTPVANASPNGCWEFEVQNVTLNACGQEYIGMFHYGGLTNALTAIINLIPTAMGTVMTTIGTFTPNVIPPSPGG